MFISILGESGVGKMTLVKMIYDSKMVETTFQVIMRRQVPADATVEVVLGRMYEILKQNQTAEDASNQPKESINDVTDKVRSLLAKKRYLLIISGISSKIMLNCLRASLPDDNNGSRVLLVLDTENEEVAWHANTMNQEGFNGIHMLSRLDEERSGQLFRSRALRRQEVVSVSADGKEDMMSSRYNKIVYDITGGYPLAIVVLAGLLRFKERPGQWEAMLQRLRPRPRMEEAPVLQGNNQQLMMQIAEADANLLLSSRKTTIIERVFWASFEDLPNDLKSCFLYCVAFPKNTCWTASTTVRMWMAEGFIKPQKGKTMEELGQSYLKELFLRCLLQVAEMNDAGGIERVFVHKSLHGFLQSEAREAGFMEVHDMHHVFVPPSVRRLAFMSFGGRYTAFTNKFPKLRSFICRLQEEQHQSNTDSQDTNKKCWHNLNFLCGSKFLRVIRVKGLMLGELPSKIGDMIHLRYLAVRCKDLKELPSSIKGLLNLQTLDIRNTQVEIIDPGFWKIRTLRHVLAEELMLPETIDEELEDLQTLHGVKPAQGGEWKEQNCPLRKMTKLRSLNLHGITHDKHGEALESYLTRMHLLSHLKLKGNVVPSCVFTAPSLRYLETVELDGIMEWPETEWDVSKVRPNLVKVKLSNTNEVPDKIKETLLVVNQRASSTMHAWAKKLKVRCA